MDKVLRFYAPRNFHDMAGMGVNAMRIPVPCRAFHDDVVVNRDFPRTVSRLLDRAEGAGLKVILVLVGGTGEDVLGLGLLIEECREAPPTQRRQQQQQMQQRRLEMCLRPSICWTRSGGTSWPCSLSMMRCC
jgi:hypothetical protein